MDLKNVIGFESTRSITKKTFDMILETLPQKVLSKAIYSISLDNIGYRIKEVLGDFFTVNDTITENRKDDVVEFCADTFGIPHNNPDSYIRFKGTLIKLTITVGYMINENTHNRVPYPIYNVSCLRRRKDIENIRDFVRTLIKVADKKAAKDKMGKTMLPFQRGAYLERPTIIKRRSFENVFIPNEQKELLIDSINNFIHRRKWYEEHSIPYHFGVLLYGTAGNGKSSVAQAIAEKWNLPMVIIPGDSIMNFEDYKTQIQIIPTAPTVILIEDVDCGMKSGTGADTKRPEGMSALLNGMDGIGALENVIYIFTTNHIEKLDPALIRPGRIDVKIDMKNVCKETFDMFTKHHYKVSIDEDIKFPSDMTFAELQTEVMKGDDLHQLIEYVKRRYDNENRSVQAGFASVD